MESLIDRITERALKCKVCGWEWLKRSPKDPDPKRCPNHTCRSPKWRGAVSTEMEPHA